MLLTISPTRLKLATSWLPPLLAYDYEFRKEAIQALVLRKYSLLPGIAIAHLAITHNLPNIPSYIRFGAFEPGSAALRFAVSRLFNSPQPSHTNAVEADRRNDAASVIRERPEPL